MAIYTSREFRRALTRTERTTIRSSGADEMAELEEELSYVTSFFDTGDPYIQDLIRAIPGITTERADALINKEE